MAQDEVKKFRLRAVCVSVDGQIVRGKLTDFTWMRGRIAQNSLQIVDKTPFRCSTDPAEGDNNPVDAVRDANGRSVEVPARATGYKYRFVASIRGADPRSRTICEGKVNSRQSPGDLTEHGDPPRYIARCHLGGGNRASFKVIPYLADFPMEPVE